jgi:type VI protein secretion system component VasF
MTATPRTRGGEAAGDLASQRRAENLAYLFQEILTVIVRLRSGRQAVTDAEVFRAQIREALRQVDQQARLRGYSSEDVNLAIFAIVALLDETILTTRNPVSRTGRGSRCRRNYSGIISRAKFSSRTCRRYWD